MDPRLKRLLIHSIKIESHVGTNADGEEAYGEPVEYKARVEQRERWVRQPSGDLLQTRHTIWIDLADVKPSDRLTLPNGDVQAIFSVARVPGRRTDEFLEILA